MPTPAEVALAIKHDVHPTMFAHKASGGQFRTYKHLMYIGDRIMQAAFTPDSRVIINVPPRHYKSTLATFWTSVWYLNWFPWKHIMLSTHSQRLGNYWGRKIRNEMKRNIHSRTSLAKDATSSNLFATPEGGGLAVFGAGAGATGFGADLLIIDDPHENMEDLYSKDKREAVHEWYKEMYSRLNKGASVFIIMQRMHPDDLCGYLLEKSHDKWDVVNLPLVAEEDDQMGRVKGEPLCRAVADEKDCKRIEAEIGRVGFLARCQQRPVDIKAGKTYPEFSNIPALGNVDPTVALMPGLSLHFTIDFNVRPGMHGIIGQYNQVEDYFTAVHEIYEEGLDLRGMMRKFGEFLETNGWHYPDLHIFGDASGNQRTMENASVGETYYSLVKAALHRMGFEQELGRTKTSKRYRIRVPKANPRIIDRVTCVNMVLCDLDGKRRYRIHPDCEELINDYRTLKNGEDGMPDKSDQERSHSSDADGYRIHFLRPILHREPSKKKT